MEDKAREEAQEEFDITEAINQFTYAIERVEKWDARTFDEMTKNALKFYISYKSDADIGETVKRFFGTLFSFLAFAIAHPVLTHKLRVSLEALDQPGAAKEFALRVMQSDKVWKRIISNETLRPHIINLATEIIRDGTIPSFETMKKEYQSRHELGAEASYTTVMYKDELVKNIDLPIGQESPLHPALGNTPDAEAESKKRAYIDATLEAQQGYINILKKPDVVDAILKVSQELMGNEEVIQYLRSDDAADIETAHKLVNEMEFPSYEMLKAKHIDEEEYTEEQYLEEIENMELPGFEAWDTKKRGAEEADIAEMSNPDTRYVIFLREGGLRTKRAYIEEVIEGKKSYLSILANPQTNLVAAKDIIMHNSVEKMMNYVPIEEGESLIPKNLLTVVGAIVEDIKFDKLDLLLAQLPFIASKLPALQGYLPSYMDLNELLALLMPPGKVKKANRKATFELIKTVFEGYVGAENKVDFNVLIPELLKSPKLWDEIMAHPTLKDYAVKVANAYVVQLEPLSFELWKEANPGDEFTDVAYSVYLKGYQESKKGYLAILGNETVVDATLNAAKIVLTNESANGEIVDYLTTPANPDEAVLIPNSLMQIIEIVLSKEIGLDKLDSLLAQAGFIINNMPAIKAAIPEYIDLASLIKAVLDPDNQENRQATFKLIKSLFGAYNYIESIYKGYQVSAEAGNTALVALTKSSVLDDILDNLTKHPSLLAYVVKLVGDYINAMDMSKPSTIGNYIDTIMQVMQSPAIWDRIINNEVLRPTIVSIAGTYFAKVASMAFEERKIVYDRLHAEDDPAAPSYTEEMYESEKLAAETQSVTYVAILKEPGVLRSIFGVMQPIIRNKANNESLRNYLTTPEARYDNLLPIDLVPVVQSILQNENLDALIENLPFIFGKLSVDNFGKDSPEFGMGFMDQALLNLVNTLFDPKDKAVWRESMDFLKVALVDNYGLINAGVGEFKKLALFDAIGVLVKSLNETPEIERFIKTHPSVASKLTRYIVRKLFDNYCIAYGIQDKFWDVLDILFQDLDAVGKLLNGLKEIADKRNYTKEDGSFNGPGTEKAVDIFVRELVGLLKHPNIGPKVINFIKDNKGVFISLIDGILANIPAAAPYVRDFVFGMGLTTSDILDQLTHNPDDLVKLLNLAKDTGALRGEFSYSGVAKAAVNKLWNREGIGVYSPAVQQVAAEIARPYVPKVVVDWTPQWFKNWIPGGKGGRDQRGEGFANWVIKAVKEGKMPNLHERLMAKVGEVNEFAKEFITYKSLSKLDFGENNLTLSNLSVEGFSFSGSKSKRIWAVGADITKTDFAGFESKEVLIKGSKLDGVKFENAKLDKVEIKGESQVTNTSFKGLKVHEFTITSSELRDVDFTGLGFINKTYYESFRKSHHIVRIEDSTIDDASLQNLMQAAKAANFNVELHNVVISKNPSKEVKLFAGDEKLWVNTSNITVMPGVNINREMTIKVAEFKISTSGVSEVQLEEVSEVTKAGQKLMEEYSAKCADTIIKHLYAQEYAMDMGLASVDEKDLRSFLESVMQDAFSRMPQQKLMYVSKMPIERLNTVLVEEDFLDVLNSVYDITEDDVAYLEEGALITLSEAVKATIDRVCSEGRSIEKREPIKPRAGEEPIGRVRESGDTERGK